jgi:hypothetical protein
MSAEERDPQGGGAAALGFYFNADDTWRNGPVTAEPWEPVWVEAEAEDRPDEPATPARRRKSRLYITLGLALVAGTAMALTWSLTPHRAPAPEIVPPPAAPALAPPLPVEAPPPEALARAPAAPAAVKPTVPRTPSPARPARASAAAPHHRQHAQPAHRHHAAATHAKPRSAAKPSKAHSSKSAPASARPAHGSGPPAAPGPRTYPFLSALPPSPGSP